MDRMPPRLSATPGKLATQGSQGLQSVPRLTANQRKQAADKSLELRKARSLIKQEVALRGAEAIEGAWRSEPAQGMKVVDLLTSLPNIGQKRAENTLAKAGIPVKNTVRGCGTRQRERLFALL